MSRHGTDAGWTVENEIQCQQGVVGCGSPFSDVLDLKITVFIQCKGNGRLLHKAQQHGVCIDYQTQRRGRKDLNQLESTGYIRGKAMYLANLDALVFFHIAIYYYSTVTYRSNTVNVI